MAVEVNQIIRSARKTLALIVEPNGALIVRAPLRASNQLIKQFVEKNIKWIEKKQRDALVRSLGVQKQYVAGEKFLYLGTEYELEIVNSQKVPLLLDGRFRLAEASKAHAALAFEHWYRHQAQQVISNRASFYANQYSFQYKKIGVTGARTRWGSCSASASLNFSWRLVLAPLQIVDYVVVHELVHTILHNHSKQFWRRVASIVPDYDVHRRWLRNNGSRFLSY